MKLFVGLGNMGPKYAFTRHNIGWRVIDELTHELNVQLDNKDGKLKSLAVKTRIGEEEVVIAKPLTMMNNSGQAVRALMDFYKIEAEDVLVAYDDLDIPFGIIKTKQGGSDGTHNGLASVTQHVGKDYWKLRLGVDRQPRGFATGHDFVLARFAEDEEEQLPEVLAAASELVQEQLENGWSVTTRRVQ